MGPDCLLVLVLGGLLLSRAQAASCLHLSHVGPHPGLCAHSGPPAPGTACQGTSPAGWAPRPPPLPPCPDRCAGLSGVDCSARQLLETAWRPLSGLPWAEGGASEPGAGVGAAQPSASGGSLFPPPSPGWGLWRLLPLLAQGRRWAFQGVSGLLFAWAWGQQGQGHPTTPSSLAVFLATGNGSRMPCPDTQRLWKGHRGGRPELVPSVWICSKQRTSGPPLMPWGQERDPGVSLPTQPPP